MPSVALIIIYNHQYNANIEKVERLYAARFDHIFHLVPFYIGEKENVIPVYENSYYFQGYVAQGAKVFAEAGFDHFLFIGDDLIVNPIVTQDNYRIHFKLDDTACFIPHLVSLHARKNPWPRLAEAVAYDLVVPGTEVVPLMPTYAEAQSKFDRLGLELGTLEFDRFAEVPELRIRSLRSVVLWSIFRARQLRNRIKRRQFTLRYPLVGSYSDIFVVSAPALRSFCHLCGIFAATRLHVEVAIPTALVLSAERIVMERDLELQGKALWPAGSTRLTHDEELVIDDYGELTPFGFDLDKLLTEFPATYLYLHPVKLSKWKSAER